MMAAFLARAHERAQWTVRYRAIPYLTVIWLVELGLMIWSWSRELSWTRSGLRTGTCGVKPGIVRR